MEQKLGNVLIAAPVHKALTDGLAGAGYQLRRAEGITQATAPALIADCVGVITSTRLQLDKELIDAAPLLQWIGRMGSGMEVIDVPYAIRRGVRCYSSPEGNCNAVGEHALGMLLGLIRRIGWSANEVQAGMWRREENRGTELEGKTIGIIGYGHTGRAFAKKLMGFDMRILVYDKYNTDAAPAYVQQVATLDTIFEQADIVSFHVPLQADTLKYFDDEFVAQMQKRFILINTSRGQVVDTAALKRGIERGRVAGACLDVIEQEPLERMSAELRMLVDELAKKDNVIITPHIAGYTHEALYKMSATLLHKIVG